MVNGIDNFRKHFSAYKDQYILIGGTACSVVMEEAGLDFRSTKDIDIVLYVEALHENFVNVFWEFIEAGCYQNKQQSTSKEIFYRFSAPKSRDYPSIIELFSRIPDNITLSRNGHLTPISINDAIVSLSAIILDNDYYHFIHSGKITIKNLPILNATHLIPIKARAYIDLAIKKKNGETIHDYHIRKHKNDIIRLFQLLSPNTRINLPLLIKKDFEFFLDEIKNDPFIDYKSIGVKNLNTKKLLYNLKEIYLSQ